MYKCHSWGVDGFDWDANNRAKCQKHGVSIAEIEALFSSPVRVRPDMAHADQEKRFQLIGRTLAGRAVFMVFTWRFRHGSRFVRPISARYMHAKEVVHYESQTDSTEDDPDVSV